MKFKYYLFALIILGISLKSIAQKVKRKAVTQNRENKKEPVAKYFLYQLNGKWQDGDGHLARIAPELYEQMRPC